ncbi:MULTISPECIES: toll/interleukin-1 receptor domain-containing protein [unclassified Saccharicrinis]|uniref:toll/interleukin-1 receptor domain-containing protein n=1 Tax=unclassified Saccharicrinis TaxID=2646859 RepID=UPI003D35046C
MNPTENNIIQNIIDDLAQLGHAKPWKSVSTLAKKFRVQESYLRQILLEYCASAGKQDLKIRYSHYPSKRNLDMIWAHVKNVRELNELYDYSRIDESDKRFPTYLGNYPRLFLSHSHKNKDRALYMRDYLYCQRINIWMSELDIIRGNDIFVAVNQGRNNCSGVLADVTEESIQSVWVQKEFIASIQDIRVYIVVDGNNGRLIEALNSDTPDNIMPSLNITSMFPEYFDYLKHHVSKTGLVFSFPYVQGELFKTEMKPLMDLKDYLTEH